MLVVIPTYNEIENIVAVTRRLRTAVPDAHVLVADDNSPDGTGKVADELAANDDHIHVLHRLGKEGLGAAYLDGFGWGLAHGYDVLVQCDADGSHQPEQLPRLLKALEHADMVKGSRWVDGGSVVNWPQVARDAVPRGQPVDADLARRAAAGRDRRLQRLPAPRPCVGSASTTSPPPATASRSTSAGGRSRPASRWSRCRSPSSNASTATRR